jgi:hypothetical protein
VEGSFEHGSDSSGSIKCCGHFFVLAQLAASQEGLGSMELVRLMGAPCCLCVCVCTPEQLLNV